MIIGSFQKLVASIHDKRQYALAAYYQGNMLFPGQGHSESRNTGSEMRVHLGLAASPL